MANDTRALQLKDLAIETMKAIDPDLANKPIPEKEEAQVVMICENLVKAFDILMSKPQ